ncbi:MAG: CHRD domain-containing protein [candidate division Zixibacteria bacterium]
MKKTARIQKTLTFSLTVLIVLLAIGPLNATVHDIDVGSFFFNPTKTVVNPGDTVRWTLVSGVHTTSSAVGSPKFWDSGILSGAPFDVVFTVGDGPGPFPYICAVHPFTMIDTIFMAPPPSDPTLFPFILDDELAADCAGTGTGASGFGLAILSPDSSNLSFFVTHNVSSVTGAHIHKAVSCASGGIAFPFSSPTSPISEGWALSLADVNALFAGSLYVNIHSSSFPGGELRGQIVPEPIRFVHTLDEAQAAAGAGTGSFAAGCAVLTLSSDGLELSVEVSHDVETTNNGHIHKGAPGVAGAFVFPFTNFNSPITEVWALDTSDIKDLFLGDLYVNIHSDSFPAGEIRGQIERQEFSLIAQINESQANAGAGTGSPAKGFGLFTLSADQRHLSSYVEHEVATTNGAHIHLGEAGIPGAIVFPFSSFSSPISETWDALSFSDVTELLDSQLYVNIHSDSFPSGEIRGQIEKKQVQYSFELSDTLANECAGTGTGASGSATTTLKPGSKELTVEVTHDVTMPIGAHIHRGFQCASGPIVFPFSGFVSPIEDIWYLSTADVVDLLQGELYVNIHSDPFPAGEIRGQLGSCCQGIRGDVNGDGDDATILDLVFLVDRIFRGGGPADCSEEADVNGDGTSASILDLTFLVDRIFRGGVAPGPC